MQAELANPSALTGDLDGNIYAVDAANRRIRNIGSDGVITTVAGNADWGTGAAGFNDEGGKPDQAKLNNPAGLTIDATGNLHVADSGNHRIRKIALPVE